MARINYQKLQEKGLTPTQIDQVIAANPQAEVYNRPSLPIETPEAIKILSQQGPITSRYGEYNPGLYRKVGLTSNPGTDIGVPTGTGVNLPQGQWQVEEQGTGWNSGWGNSVVVRNAQTGEKLRFSHLNKMLRLKPGQTIEGGKQIAESGASGNVTGPHIDINYTDPEGRVRDVLSSSYGKMLY